MQKYLLVGVLLIMVASASTAYADTVYLKNGDIISGEILEHDDASVRVQVGPVPRRFSADQVDFIEKDGDIITLAGSEPPAPEDKSLDSSLPGLSMSKEDVILKLIDVSGMRASIQKNVEGAIDNMPLSARPKFENLINVDDIINNLIPVYSQHYSLQELNNLVEFYQTPTGQKLLETTPVIAQEAMQATADYFKKKIVESGDF